MREACFKPDFFMAVFLHSALKKKLQVSGALERRPCRLIGTPHRRACFSGVNGKSLPSEVLFNHVSFFSGKAS
jgi:hypothetical protein